MFYTYEKTIERFESFYEREKLFAKDSVNPRDTRIRFYRHIRDVYTIDQLLGFIEFLNNNPQYEDSLMRDLKPYIGKAYLEKLDVCIDLGF